MSTCAECGYRWGAPPEHVVAVIAGLPDRLSRLLLDDSRLRTRPAAGVWSPLEYLAHTGDAIGWYAERIDLVLTEDRPRLEPFDWDAHTADQRYHDRRPADVLAGVRATCGRLSAVLQALTGPEWAREGIGSDGSARSVGRLADRAGHEAHHHLRDVERGLGAPG